MICIECAYNEIDRLYFKYKSEYIKLTICPNCQRIADKYIEYDNVVLFLDILLLKAPAYRHLAYNVTEAELVQKTDSGTSTIKNFIVRYRKLLRLITLIVLFEVYLTWAYEEKQQWNTLAMRYILTRPIYYQYLFFLLRLIAEQLVLNLTIQLVYRKLFKWGHTRNKNLPEASQNGYYTSVLLLTVLVSSSIKLFPILMLIWPYDKTSISGPVINIIAFINIIEALTIITNSSYLTATAVLLVATLLQLFISKQIVSLIISHFSGIDLAEILLSERTDLINLARKYKDLWTGIRDSILS
ncbi:Arv1-like protein [Suhomyces tanzawaensis NRRL Y-17324]|uniref:Protein ARV n=1 Tax=Suhomyces tanzawaensis NRRL Y-17324 TaxID=984487 RepID=A0A1E4SGE5_9ASCO|nr:Arv1-like protein [Suhomyces tanzawaensis NRRL Y-17324]ODV78581.1 Arv1-like protein [Suhomyces tanzawaensis NRRL Y-17324]